MSESKTIVLASNNPGKIDEINRMLAPTAFRVVAQSEFGVEEAVEDGLTFVENALIKARNAAVATGLSALADDSGLVVDALNGMPGVISARYSGPDADHERNNRKLLDELKNVDNDDRSCSFRCVMVYLRHGDDASPLIAEGDMSGVIHSHAQGEHGFGYDPIVWLPELNCTVAELPIEQKNEISHRSKALRAIVDMMTEHIDDRDN